MTQMYRFFVITGMLAVPCMLALSQDFPEPPPPAQIAPPAVWPSPAPRAATPPAAPKAWIEELSMPPQPPMPSQPPDWPTPAIAPMPPMAPMELLDTWDSVPAIAPAALMHSMASFAPPAMAQ